MSVAANREIARRFIEDVWAKADVAAAREIIADGLVINDGHWPGQPPGPEGQVWASHYARRAFPDMVWTVDLVVADEQLAVERWTMRGTFSGPLGARQPTGKKAVWTGIDILRIADGKIVEMWHAENAIKDVDG